MENEGITYTWYTENLNPLEVEKIVEEIDLLIIKQAIK